jgi:hypothetical protein
MITDVGLAAAAGVDRAGRVPLDVVVLRVVLLVALRLTLRVASVLAFDGRAPASSPSEAM